MSLYKASISTIEILTILFTLEHYLFSFTSISDYFTEYVDRYITLKCINVALE